MATAKKATKKTAAKKATAKKTATKQAATKKAAAPAAKKTTKPAAKSVATKTTKSAAKAPAKKASTSGKPATKRPEVAKKSSTGKGAPATAKKSASTGPARSNAATKGSSTSAPATKASPARRTPIVAGGKDPQTAGRHLQQLLEAKQERTRQGPSYPAANAHTGRTGSDRQIDPPHSDIDPHAADAVDTSPSPDALFGSGNVAHARGNQGMRKQR